MSRVTRRVVSLLLAVAVMGVGPAVAADPSPPGRESDQIIADYNREIREETPRADGIRHVDTQATIARLKEAHVTDYYYLVWHERTDWDDLIAEFLPAAERSGIDVWVYLVPPSECNPLKLCSFPYQTDYVTWAKEIGRLSQRFTNLKGWAMDDFLGTGNYNTFTPSYVAEMTQAGKAINPDLEFFPVLYADDFDTEFLRDFGPYFDGAIFPYTLNYRDTEGLAEELDRIREQLSPYDAGLVLMIYATKISTGKYPPSAEYVEAALRLGLEYMMEGKLRGVTTYAMAKEFEDEPCGFADHLDLTVPDYTRTVPGDYVTASQTVQLDPAAPTYQLSLWEQDSYPIGTMGYHFKQVLVDGVVVWEQDVGADPAVEWTQRIVDLTPFVAGQTEAEISLRLYDKKGVSNFGIRVSFAHLEPTGFTVTNPDFTGQSGWDFAIQGPGGAVFESVVCDPQRQLHVFENVRDLYGPYALYARAEEADVRQAAPLLARAMRVLTEYRQGDFGAAAHDADVLARMARGAKLTILSEQAAAVADDLRRQR